MNIKSRSEAIPPTYTQRYSSTLGYIDLQEPTNTGKYVIMYHAGCNDGLVGAGIVYKYLTSNKRIDLDYVKCIPVSYGKPIPEIDAETVLVYIVDFAYGPQELFEYAKARPDTDFLTIDHHASASEKWDGVTNTPNNVCTYIDSSGEFSGAGLAWDILYPEKEAPDLVKDVQDRDLWKFKRSNSKEVHQYLLMLTKDDQYIPEYVANKFLSPRLEHRAYTHAVSQGIPLKAQFDTFIKMSAQNAFVRVLTLRNKEYLVVMVNCSIYSFISDTCDYILENADEFGINENDTTVIAFNQSDFDKVNLSFRSKNKTAKVLAEHFGGGGHPNAAGAKIKYFEWQMVGNLLHKAPDKES